ncbi:MAG: multicomponent Na+:H+ antiporter subunit E [Paraglaciecola sp.]
MDTNRQNVQYPNHQHTLRVSRQLISGMAIRVFIFSVLWISLTGWEPDSWAVGSVFIFIASLLSFHLAPAQSLPVKWVKNPATLLSFLSYFSLQSLRGGWDIAKLALLPNSKISPGFVKFHTNLTNDSQVIAFMQVLSLLPGTVSATKNGPELTIHVLDLNSFNPGDIDDCQIWVGRILPEQDELGL